MSSHSQQTTQIMWVNAICGSEAANLSLATPTFWHYIRHFPLSDDFWRLKRIVGMPPLNSKEIPFKNRLHYVSIELPFIESSKLKRSSVCQSSLWGACKVGSHFEDLSPRAARWDLAYISHSKALSSSLLLFASIEMQISITILFFDMNAFAYVLWLCRAQLDLDAKVIAFAIKLQIHIQIHIRLESLIQVSCHIYAKFQIQTHNYNCESISNSPSAHSSTKVQIQVPTSSLHRNPRLGLFSYPLSTADPISSSSSSPECYGHLSSNV